MGRAWEGLMGDAGLPMGGQKGGGCCCLELQLASPKGARKSEGQLAANPGASSMPPSPESRVGDVNSYPLVFLGFSTGRLQAQSPARGGVGLLLEWGMGNVRVPHILPLNSSFGVWGGKKCLKSNRKKS